MPSLASEESPTSGRGLQRHVDWQRTVEPNTPSIETLPSSEQTAVNALLMAARVMTEATKPLKHASGEEVRTPSTINGIENDGTPDDSVRTAQRNLLGKFISPKRKADDTVETSEDPSSRIQANRQKGTSKSKGGEKNKCTESSEDSVQFTKRTRLNSLGKDRSDDCRRDANIDNDATAISTPAKGKRNTLCLTKLTPVSARCIDFKNMSISDTKGSPAPS
jgi:hypothetical protein